MAVDSPIPLATPADLQSGGFADLVRSFSDVTLADLMQEATRACETECGRRLAPFTGLVETHRAEGVDPDEYSDSLMPLDLLGALGRSKASAYGGAGSTARHCWLNEYAPRFSDLWAYSDVSIEVILSVGGSQTFTGDAIIGPEPDSGHVWFRAGSYIPVGSLIRATYSGGYQTVPRDLVRACTYMGAAIAARDLDPMQQPGHDPTQLEGVAAAWLAGYARA